MSTNKFTPGPWLAEESETFESMPIIIRTNDGPINRMICRITTHNVVYQEAEANANLIAAAPDLLEALQGMISFIQSHGITIPANVSTAPVGKAKAAIAKATASKDHTQPNDNKSAAL